MENDALKICPFCKEQIRNEAVKCRYCGEWLEEKAKNIAAKNSNVHTTPEITTAFLLLMQRRKPARRPG
jgi:hypothetical protein